MRVQIPFWSRLRLAPRIALVIVGSLLAVEAVDKLMPLVIRPPDVMFMDRDWLLDRLEEYHSHSLKTPAAERMARLQDLPAQQWLDVATLNAPLDFSHTERPGGFADLHQRIAKRLGLTPQDVVIRADDPDDPEYSRRPLVIILPPLPIVITDVFDERSANMLSSDLRIAVRIGPEEWLMVTPKSDGQEMVRMIRNVALPLLAVVLIGAVSIWVARGIVKPLDDLAAAAEKLGRERELSLVGDFNTPELQAIGNSFNAMQRRLKRFVDDRLHMIAAISHDLRTPLTRLRLFAEYLPDPDQRRQVLSDINDMEEMVSTTLTFASNRLKNEARSAVDLASLAISLCDTAADAGCAIIYDGPDHAELTCRPVAIRRALGNLIDNGCKFGSRVVVTLRASDKEIIITVADDGPGIPIDQREDAFRPFMRLESSRNRETGGTGLGLTIARDVIHAHDGTITLGKADIGGLLVTVTIPKVA
jgi:signal transduction histidine kinase